MNYKMLLLQRGRERQIFCDEPSPFDYLQLRNYEALRAWYRRLAEYQAAGADGAIGNHDMRPADVA